MNYSQKGATALHMVFYYQEDRKTLLLGKEQAPGQFQTGADNGGQASTHKPGKAAQRGYSKKKQNLELRHITFLSVSQTTEAGGKKPLLSVFQVCGSHQKPV